MGPPLIELTGGCSRLLEATQIGLFVQGMSGLALVVVGVACRLS